MKKNFLLPIFLMGIFCLIVTAISAQRISQNPKADPVPDLQQVNQQFAAQGLRFTENKGQVADLNGRLRPDILFTAQNEGVKLFLTANGIHYQFRRDFAKPVQEREKPEIEEGDSIQFYRLDLSLKGADPNPEVIKEGAGTDVENFFLAHCPDGITGVKNYSRITYKEVYPNIDWVVYVKAGMLEYDFVLRPGGNIEDIQLQYNGAKTLALDNKGALHIKTPLGKVTEQKPYSFQQEGREVASSFVLEGNCLGFEVPAYDKNKVLTIDPVVIWATYYGGSNEDQGRSVATDPSGNVYLAGYTYSTNGIASEGHQNSIGGGEIDAFLVKFNTQGQRQWATYYGGNGYEYGFSVTTDATGNVYLAGQTTSSSSIASGGHQNSIGGNTDAFVVKFNAQGQRQWATYYGGNSHERGYSVATDASGNVYLAGHSGSGSGIASGGHQNSFSGGYYDAFLVKFNGTGLRLWATYYGGSGVDYGYSVATDASGNVYLAGYTASTNAIASEGHQNSIGGGEDAFIVKFNGSGVRIWGTYYGGSGVDHGYTVTTDGSGNVFLAGYTGSASDIASGGHQINLGGDQDAFLVKFNGSGVRQWGTYYGGTGLDYAYAVTTDGSGNVYLDGPTSSTTGIASGGVQNSLGGSQDAYLVKFNGTGVRQWATYFGNRGFDAGFSVATDGLGNVYFAGYTRSSSGIASGGHQNTFGGGYSDAFLVRITDIPPTDNDEDGVPDAIDCAPNDATKYRTANLYIDKDNDDYDAGQENICYGATVPAGYKATSLGTDCDDENNEITTFTWYKDSDNDGYSNGNTLMACNRPSGYKTATELTANAGDCNDNNAAINPAATEVCDGIDNDCNGEVDLPECDSDGDGVPNKSDCAPNDPKAWQSDIFYYDADGDGVPGKTTKVLCYGDESASELYPYIKSPASFDCNDNCDRVWNSLFGYLDEDKDGYHGRVLDACVIIYCDDGGHDDLIKLWYLTSSTTLGEDCDDGDAAANVTKPWYKDSDYDGYGDGSTLVECIRPSEHYYQPNELIAISGDCNDGNEAIYPGATELCDGIDNDCDAQTDEGCPVGNTWYLDYDNDGYGNPAKKVQATTRPRGYIARDGDCRDWDPLSYPGAPETGDGIDNDCDGLVDEGLPCLKTWYYDGDGDGFGSDAYTRLSCKQHNGYVPLGGDCKNWDANVYPGHGCPPITGADGNIIQPKAMVETSTEITVFPNPARDEITVTLNGFEVGKKLELHMVQADGKVVSGQSITPLTHGQQVRINVSRLSAGYYLLQARQGVLQQTKKVMIVK